MRIKQCISIIRENFGNDVLIEPIGNHHLGRHFVFKVTKDMSYVMKFYFKEHKWEREISALNLLNAETHKTPNVLNYGVTDDVEWLLYEYFDGQTLNNVELDDESLKKIYFNLGQELAIIHRDNQYDKFGRLDLNGEFYIVNDTNKEYVQYIFESTLKNLALVNHDRKELVNRATKILKEDIDALETDEKGSLCHNDLSDRNIIVRDGKFELLFDFEQSSISDRYREIALINYYLTRRGEIYFNAFLEGYQKHYSINLNVLNQREKTYLLLHGIMICSWSLEVNKDYYDEGIALLEKYC